MTIKELEGFITQMKIILEERIKREGIKDALVGDVFKIQFEIKVNKKEDGKK